MEDSFELGSHTKTVLFMVFGYWGQHCLIDTVWFTVSVFTCSHFEKGAYASKFWIEVSFGLRPDLDFVVCWDLRSLFVLRSSLVLRPVLDFVVCLDLRSLLILRSLLV